MLPDSIQDHNRKREVHRQCHAARQYSRSQQKEKVMTSNEACLNLLTASVA